MQTSLTVTEAKGILGRLVDDAPQGQNRFSSGRGSALVVQTRPRGDVRTDTGISRGYAHHDPMERVGTHQLEFLLTPGCLLDESDASSMGCCAGCALDPQDRG